MNHDLITPMTAAFTAHHVLATLLASTPIYRGGVAAPAPLTPPEYRVHRATATLALAPYWNLHTTDALAGTLRGPLARIARTLKAATRAGGEIVMLPWEVLRLPPDFQGGDWCEAVYDYRSGIRLRTDGRIRHDATNVLTFTVLYRIQETPERAREEWFRDLHAYALAEA